MTPILQEHPYGEFDLTRILEVIRPVENGIAFQRNGMHAIEDYVLSRYQMYMQVYFHPGPRAMVLPAESPQTRQGNLSRRQGTLTVSNFPTPPACCKNVTLSGLSGSG